MKRRRRDFLHSPYTNIGVRFIVSSSLVCCTNRLFYHGVSIHRDIAKPAVKVIKALNSDTDKSSVVCVTAMSNNNVDVHPERQ